MSERIKQMDCSIEHTLKRKQILEEKHPWEELLGLKMQVLQKLGDKNISKPLVFQFVLNLNLERKRQNKPCSLGGLPLPGHQFPDVSPTYNMKTCRLFVMVTSHFDSSITKS
jgi:hypothetical protein